MRITLTNAELSRGFIRGDDRKGEEQSFWFEDIKTLNGFITFNKK